MILRNLKINPGVIILFALFFCVSAFAADTPAYTVRLGEFKTISAITEFYHLVPEKYQSKSMVCRQRETYILNCGSYAQEKDIQPLFGQLKELGLNPQIVKQPGKTASGICSPADAFFKSVPQPPAPPPPAPGNTKQKAYNDLNDPDVITGLDNASKIMLPEVTTKILLSNRDVNRIICQNGPIKDIVYSQEKGISVKTSSSNAFVKFLITNSPLAPNMTYSETPSEIYVVCGDDNTVYTLIAMPKDIPAQTIELASSKKSIKKTLSLFKGLAFEKKVILLIQSAYRNDAIDSFTVKIINRPLNVFREMDVLYGRQIVADGEGLTLNEYILSMKPTSAKSSIPLDEKFFLIPELTQKPVGIALERMALNMGQTTRLFIVEKHTD
ncbi:MAG: type-F conjugative transfer system secretin TraK [Desulfobacteraceae bacterium]|nr:type-F conjugative transfer system secretin TraK [Desulfobacteraceae bacterium]